MLKPKSDSNDKILKDLREIVSSGNKNCFDCGQKGVTAIDMTIGSFVCTTCSGILRGLTPPHRVKSISMAKFTSEELDFLRTHGNDECAKTWLGLWDSKRTIKQDHREFMIDKYERKRYYLEPASPLKSISTVQPIFQQQQPSQPLTNGNAKISHQQVDNSLAVLKSIQLTPPAANNRHHHRTHHQNGHANGFADSQNNNNFFSQQNNNLKGNSSHNGSIKSDNSNDFIADFSKASIYNSNNSLNSTESGGKMTNGTATNGDLNANFADFENNKIYNAAEEHYKSNNNNTNMTNSGCNASNIQWNIWQQFQWPNQPEQNRWSLPMTKSSLSNSLNSSGGTFNSNSSLNSTPSADRYAALKDLDEQLRDAKTGDVTPTTEPTAIPANPFKNPFQSPPQNHQQQQQNYQNWTIPESQSPFDGFGSPLNTNGFSNGFYYNHNMTNGIISQPSAFGKQGGFGNPFVTSGSASANNPFL